MIPKFGSRYFRRGCSSVLNICTVWKKLVTVTLAVVIALSGISAAYAAGGGGIYQNAASECEAKYKDKGIIERVVMCIKDTVRKTIYRFFNEFYPYVAHYTPIGATLAITLFGVYTVSPMGLEKPGRDAFMLLFKITLVVYLVDKVPMMYDWTVDSMDDATDIVFQFGKGGDGLKCQEGQTLWERVDCMLDMLVGFKTKEMAKGSGGNFEQLQRGFQSFFFHSASSSPMGAAIGLLGAYMTYALLLGILKAVMIYTLAYIAIAFVFVFGPIFIPMAMFKFTKEYFDKWVRILISYAIQPVIVFAYLSFCMIALDTMIYSGKGSFCAAIAGAEECKKKDFNLMDYIDNKNKALKKDNPNVTTAINTAYDSETPATDPKSKDKGFIPRVKSMPHAPKNNFQLIRQEQFTTDVDWCKLNDARKPPPKQKVSDKCKNMQLFVLSSAITAAMTMYIFITMLKYIPTLAADLAGEVGVSLGGVVDKAVAPLEQKLDEMANKAAGQFKGQIGQLLGTRR